MKGFGRPESAGSASRTAKHCWGSSFPDGRLCNIAPFFGVARMMKGLSLESPSSNGNRGHHMTGFRFTYERLDRLVKLKTRTPGYSEPSQPCDCCRSLIRLSDTYELTPVDFRPWLAESRTLRTLIAFGLRRCRQCIPSDAVPAGEALDSRWRVGGDAPAAVAPPFERKPQRRRIVPNRHKSYTVQLAPGL